MTGWRITRSIAAKAGSFIRLLAYRGGAFFAGPYADAAGELGNENFPVAYLACPCAFNDRVDGFIDEFFIDRHIDPDLAQ